jgi:ribose transport system ATP-binding protein
MPDQPPLLEMRGIDKRFPGVHALKRVNLELYAGEVLAVMGENGAGKSTLIKTLGGVRPDSGSILINGQAVQIDSPLSSVAAGIAIIYQEFNLIPGLKVRENIFLGRELSRATFINRRAERLRVEELFTRLGVRIDPEALCRDLSIAEQQSVEIAKALSFNARIIVMDEPTATLTPQEVSSLLSIVRDLREQGIGIVYISHRLEEIEQVADRVLVLRDGEQVATRQASELNRADIIELMVGRKLESEFPKHSAPFGKARLVAKNLTRGTAVRGVSFEVRAGEVVALTGLVGAGRTEVARLIFGADDADSGEILVDGEPLVPRAPSDAIRRGVCLLPEDRKHQGLILAHSIQDNFSLPNLRQFSRFGWINRIAESSALDSFQQQLKIKLASRHFPVSNLSGGNQQKVVLAKWLQSNAGVVIFDEPTRGIDVGAKYEIYLLMNELAARGKAILMISSELPEVLGMADRILVMHEGRITGEITDVTSATQNDIMELAVK